MSIKIKYRCEFSFRDQHYHVINDEGIGAFINGFWVNGYCQFTTGDDAKYWIPPWKIDYIAKDSVKWESK